MIESREARMSFARSLASLTALALVVLPLAAASAQEIPPPAAALERMPVAPATARVSAEPGQRVVGELRLPAGRGPFPVAILVHGGCWLEQLGDERQMRPLAEALRAEGIATWNVIYRGVDEPGGGWPGTLRDVAVAADELRALAGKYPLDTAHVVAVGHAAGAALAGWLATRPLLSRTDPDIAPLRGRAPVRVHGVVAIDGPLDLLAARALVQRGCMRPVLDMLLGGTPSKLPMRWRATSPSRLLSQADASVRLALVVAQLDAAFLRITPAASLESFAAQTKSRVFDADSSSHFSMLDPAQPAFEATRDAVRFAMGLLPEGRRGADGAALRAAYRTWEAGVTARELRPALSLLAPDFEHHSFDGRGGTRVTPRAAFVEGVTSAVSSIDTLYAFSIDVSDVAVASDSAQVRYREHMDARVKPVQPGAAARRDSSTSYWNDRWVRTPAGWRVVRFVEVAPPR